MFDIAAFLSVKPAGPGADIAPAAGTPGGMEAADIQAFGDILAGRIGGQAAGQTPDAASPVPFAAPPAIAGKLPEGGKILPDGLPVAPDMLPPVVATLAIPVLAPAAADPLSLAALKPMPEAEILPEDAPTQPAPVAPEARRAEVLAKLLAASQALKAALPKITAERPGEAKPDIADDADAEAAPESALAATATATTALPALPIPVETALVPAPIALPVPQYAQTPVTTADEPAGETASAKPAPARPVATGIAALSAAAIPTATPTIAAQPATPAPLPTIAAANPAETTATTTPIAVLPAQPAPVNESGRFRVAQAPAKAAKASTTEPASLEPTAPPPAAAKPAAAVAAQSATQTAEQPAEPARAAFVRAAISGDERERRAAPAFQPVSTLADLSQAQAQPQGAAGVAPVQAAATPTQPGHDFVKLVDRLIEARDSAAPQSVVSAAIKHAEFGQVSLHFQQDASGLTVSMASPDPDFQPAVQAAMPADRGGMASDQGQGQAGQNQQNQSGGSASFLPQDQRGAGTSGEQSRTAQERNPRAAGNPSQAARDEGEKPDRRSGIFA